MTKNYTMENQENHKKKFYSFNLTVEDKVVFAVLMSLLSIIISIGFNVFYKPSWANKIVSTNEQLNSKINAVTVNKETLILIGGGTIHEYFHENGIFKKCYEVMDSTSIIPIRVASLDACKTLKDETENSSNGWIVLSSTKATAEDFMDAREAEEFKRKKRIVEVFLDKDRLLVITTKDKCFNQISKEKHIHVHELENTLKQLDNDNSIIFTTSANSGTLKLYKDIIGSDFINLKNVKVFDLHTTYPEKTPYIILCSDVYKPKNYGSKNSNSYYVYASKNDLIEKELYLYFTANCIGNSIDIPNSIKKFMPIVKKDFDIKDIKLTNELIVR